MSKPLAISRRVAIGGALAMLLPAAAQASQHRQGRISGNVLYRERMLLPRNAVVEVSLLDVSLADARARTIATTRVRGRTASPIPYRLVYDRSRLSRRGTYALQARITVGGHLMFINTQQHAVEPRARNRVDVWVERVAV